MSYLLYSLIMENRERSSYAVIVLGPSGSGKSTFCDYLSQFYGQINRTARIVNVDPGNNKLPYDPYVDITDLITISDVKEEYSLGYAYKPQRRFGLLHGFLRAELRLALLQAPRYRPQRAL